MSFAQGGRTDIFGESVYMFCKYCGAERDGDERFCVACGKPVSVDFVTQYATQPKSKVVDSTVTNKYDFCFILTLATAIAITIILLSTNLLVLRCEEMRYGQNESTEVISVAVFKESESNGSHWSSNDIEDALASVDSACGIMFAFVTALVVAMVLSAFKKRYDIVSVLSLITIMLTLVILAVIANYWENADEMESTRAYCLHTLKASPALWIVFALLVVMLLMPLIERWKYGTDKENDSDTQSSVTKVN